MLQMFDALLPYFGGKRRLVPVIFHHIARYLPRSDWSKATFVDGFLGSGAVSLFAKAQGFKVICNDISERSFIAGKALIENNKRYVEYSDKSSPGRVISGHTTFCNYFKIVCNNLDSSYVYIARRY